MPTRPDFVAYVLEVMAAWHAVEARKMFGGYGLYREARMFALIADDQLYLKVDEGNRAAFAARGCSPFVYLRQGRPQSMAYWSAPADCLESPADMAHWCDLAWQAALRAPTPKRKQP